MTDQYCDDPEIKELLEKAIPLLYQAQKLNEQKVKELEQAK